ncbi:helix-turn-helix domain-containing protein [Arcobacter sp. HD9-500m-PIT-SAG03]|nr:helix-turn-helix domain-containing protein [Arcobacter sp. HD9-500m-PIT-SAG03]
MESNKTNNHTQIIPSNFGQRRRNSSLPSMSITESINVYKSVHAQNPTFGMDIFSKDFNPHGFVILQNNGEGNIGIPICFSHYVLLLNLKGTSVRHVNQYSYDVNAQSLQLLIPGVIYSFEDSRDDFELFIILFDQKFLSKEYTELLEFFQSNYEPSKLNQNSFAQVLSIYEQLNLEYKDKKIDYQGFSKILLIQLLYILKREKTCLPQKEILNRSEQISNHFLSLIEEHFQNRKSVQEYADILEITPKHLSETIKDTLDKSALSLIHVRIIKEIQYQLCYTTLSIKQISSSLYFANSSDFGRFFKRYQGLSPKAYRLKFQR